MQDLFSSGAAIIFTAISAIELAARNAFRPPPRQTLTQWADTNAYLSAESTAEPGRWRTLPYQKGIMDAFTCPRTEQVSVMKSARVGWSKIINNVVGYHMHNDACPIMVVQPTIEDAKGYSKEEIAPMLRDTPALRGLVQEARAKDSDNSILHKKFPGGVLSVVGANSPRGFRRVSRRIVLFDEVDGYPSSAGAEGDQIKLGIKRTEYYWNRKIGAGSTPTTAGISRIERLFLQSDQRRYFVPCPHCGEKQFLKWGGKEHKFGIKWPDGEPEKAYYVCEHNGCIIEHTEKRWMVERGEWIATNPAGAAGHAGFHIWAAYSYSPNATWGHLAKEFLECKNDPEQLKTFVNTTLGEVWEEEYSAKIGAEGLAARAEPYDLLTVPEGGLVLTAAVDVQDNRLEFLVKAWGRDEENWVINYGKIFGDPAQQDVWDQLDSVLLMQYRHATGPALRVFAAMIDTGGHYTHETYAYVRKWRKSKRPFVLAIKGASRAGKVALGKPTWQDVNHKGQTIKKGVALWPLGVDTIKSTVYGRLKLSEPSGAGVYHWPIGLPQEYFDQLTAEKCITKYRNGYPVKVWVKRSGDRNESFDMEVYAYAALLFLYTRYARATFWPQLEKELAKKQTAPQNADQPPTPAPPEVEAQPEAKGTGRRRTPKRGPMRPRNGRTGGRR